MIPGPTQQMAFTMSILHVCGDDPAIATYEGEMLKYSPCMWR